MHLYPISNVIPYSRLIFGGSNVPILSEKRRSFRGDGNFREQFRIKPPPAAIVEEKIEKQEVAKSVIHSE